ncbi:MAG: 2Fe-2S iron-sulfur cluster-binding protein [Acidimicrobiales bacterium]
MSTESQPAQPASESLTPVELRVDGRQVQVAAEGTLLAALREDLDVRAAKAGCSPQGQCGCCTVWVDGKPRVSCVTPVRRMADRDITTIDGLDDGVRQAWGDAFCGSGGSQCGYCTPGIIMRFERLRQDGVAPGDPKVARALHAHLCRCTGWQTVLDAYAAYGQQMADRDFGAAEQRAALEGRTSQAVGPEVALGDGLFADESAPTGALVAVPNPDGGWTIAESLPAARKASGKVQGRRTTVDPTPPIPVPEGDWDAVLQTGWVEPGYLETDASWCEPGGEPRSVLGTGGAFGGKVDSSLGEVARRLADEHGRAVRVVLSREDTVRMGPKRPPMAGGANADGTGHFVVARTPGIADAIHAVAPDFVVEEIDIPGPSTSVALRAAGWAEAVALLAGARGEVGEIAGPNTGVATAEVSDDQITVRVRPGQILDETVLRSYCIGAAHMAYSWVTSESIAVDETGAVLDLTIRSFGIVRATETPTIVIELEEDSGPAVNVSDAVFAAVAAATWLHRGTPRCWPTN